MSQSSSNPERSPGGLTAQQQAAVVCRGASVVLSSGAGCGKTHVLTERYLAHLRDDGAEVGQLVAITFTDRAARQMRDRIRKKVREAVRSAPTDEEANRWAGHLRNLETAQLTTIHAFCAALLRQHAVEAGLDPRFEVLDDVLAVNLESAALTECLQKLLTGDDETSDDLKQLVLLYGWRPTVGAVQALLRDWDAPAWQRWLEVPAEQMADRWLSEERPRVLKDYVAYLAAASPKIAGCLALLRSTECIGPLMQANVAYLLQETPRLAKAGDLGEAIQELTETAKVGKERGKAWRSEEDYRKVLEALDEYRGELREKLQSFAEPPENLAETVAVGRRFLHVAEAAALSYRQHKRRAGAVDFQDLLVQTRDLLRDHPPVREALQRRYRFLLVDELQDTDPVQMELVESLAGAGLTAGKLFAVGDHKQSIYRFRKAEVRLFQELRQRMPHEGRLDLNVNFRSQPAILDFTNALLGHRLGEEEKYVPLEANRPQVNSGPCVEFLWAAVNGKESVDVSRAREADRMARRIAAMIAGREALAVEKNGNGSLRPVQPGDIVVLFRAMTNVSIYENALRKQGIDYYLVGGRAFFAQQEIYDLLNLLRALENPQDAVNLAGALRAPFCCLSDEALFRLATHPDGLWAGLHDAGTCSRLSEEQRAVADRARRFLDRWRGMKDRAPIAELLGRVFADSGYDAAMRFEFLGDRKLANLWKLLDMARDFDRSGLFGLADFIARLGDQVRGQAREEQAATQPENADVVRLMSIHQAKGLEFPVVFLPDLAAKGGDARHRVAVWDKSLGCVAKPPPDEEEPPFPNLAWELWKASEKVADWHEDLRTLYVACTRAEDYLVLSASLPGTMNSWMLTLAERFDLPTGTCRDESIPAERQPKVRVVAEEAPESSVSPLPRTRGRGVGGEGAGFAKAKSPSPPTPLPRSTGGEGRSPVHIAPIPVRLTHRDVIPLSAWEEFLRTGKPLRAEQLAWQFVTEDGSDRNAWASGGREPEETINRLMVPSGGLRPPLAGKRYRDLEFLLEVDEALPMIAGTIDSLWQDAAGDWHLLGSAPGAEELGLIVQAWAVERRFGKWPKTVQRLDEPRSSDNLCPLFANELSDEYMMISIGDPAKRLAEVRAALSDFLAQPPAD